MNDQSPGPVSPSQAETGQALSQNSEPSLPSQPGSGGQEPYDLTGRELVVIEQEERSSGWFNRFLMRLGLRSSGSLRDDLNEALAGEGEAGGVFSPEERAMLRNILRLRERRVEDVMVPRAEVQAVDLDMPLSKLLQRFEETGHSRLPVYEENLDDPRGMVLIKDLLLHMTSKAGKSPKPARKKGKDKEGAAGKNANPAQKTLDLGQVDLDASLSSLNVIRKVLFVPPSMLASDLMARMQATRTQMALVIDEYGGTDGLVSLEDIVEEVVGEIEDEHDDDDDGDLQLVLVGDGIWTADARTELEKVTEDIGAVFNPGDRGEDVDTLGGLVFALAGHIPVRGEVVRGLPGFEFRVLDADPRCIRRLQIVQTSLRDRRRKTMATRSAAE